MARHLTARVSAIAGRVLGLVARRVALLVVLLALVFAAVELLPGDAATATVERGSSAADVAARRAELGLDAPVWLRFARFLTALGTGEFGTTTHGEPVAAVLGAHVPHTLLLGGVALVLTALVAGLVALASTALPTDRRPAGRIVDAAATVALALPEFVVAGVLVLVFALILGWFPAVTLTTLDGGIASPAMLVLPVLALAVPQIGWNVRIARAALADELRAPHVDAAVLDGLPRWRVLVGHVLPGALLTIAAGLATSTGMLLGGAVVVETIFGFPGIGTVLAAAVADRDTTLVAAVVATTGLVIMALLVVADLVRDRAVGRLG